MEKTFLVAASVFGFLAVVIGAFGAHSLSDYFADQPKLEANYKTAVLYQMFHVVALVVVAFAITRWEDVSLFNWAGYAFILGILLFSGSLYILSLTGIRWLGAITPLGGLAFLAGWACLAIGILRS